MRTDWSLLLHRFVEALTLSPPHAMPSPPWRCHKLVHVGKSQRPLQDSCSLTSNVASVQEPIGRLSIEARQQLSGKGVLDQGSANLARRPRGMLFQVECHGTRHVRRRHARAAQRRVGRVVANAGTGNAMSWSAKREDRQCEKAFHVLYLVSPTCGRVVSHFTYALMSMQRP
jgi:hypothetical protein